ncbi:MAG: flagellar protein [Lachnospiraceae bacterium]|nr:flagellar protein [Lachnospiraceae bacterium]
MGFTVETCGHCQRLFNYPGFGSKYCPDCRKIDEENRNIVKEYLREHGQANMYEISIATGVPEADIKQYLRDGMLEIPEGSPIYIKCEACGCDIRYGKWCPACAARLSSDLKGCLIGVGDVPKEKMSGKMRFLGKR